MAVDRGHIRPAILEPPTRESATISDLQPLLKIGSGQFHWLAVTPGLRWPSV